MEDDVGGGSGIESMGDTPVANTATMGISSDFADGDLPKEFQEAALRNDPELRELKEQREAKKAARKENADTKKAARFADTNEMPHQELPGKTAKAAATSGDSEGEEPDFETLDFQDDIIPGLKGEHVKKLGAEAAGALAEYHEKHTELSEKYKTEKSRFESLLADPVIKQRAEMLSQGRNDYSVRQVTGDERQAAINLLQNRLDFQPEEAAAAFDLLKDGFDKVAKDAAEDFLKQGLLEQDMKQKQAETVTKARSVFLNLGQFNKNLAFKETDPNKFWTVERDVNGAVVHKLNEDHLWVW